MLGTLFLTGVDITAADPMLSIDDIGAVPVLILQGSEDREMQPDTAQRMADKAAAAGVSAEVHVCPGAGHSQIDEVCADDYRSWVLGFLARSQAQ
jgi:pimeloyl-ACP methyl ester carboxylesterase